MDEETRDMIWFFEFMPKSMRKKKRRQKLKKINKKFKKDDGINGDMFLQRN
jgi:hypothetical protein